MRKTTDWIHIANNVIENCNYVIQRLKITRDCDACIKEHEDLQKLAKQFLEIQKENVKIKARLEKSVELPCKVGDTVYFSSFFSSVILEDTVTKISFIGNGWSISTRERRFTNDEFNRKFFLTREQALKERE